MNGLRSLAGIAMLGAGMSFSGGGGPSWSPSRERRDHIISDKPLSKRAKRRLRGKAKAKVAILDLERGL